MTTIAGLDVATTALGTPIIGPPELERALGFDPLSILTADERRVVETLPFSAADLAQARSEGRFLVLRIPRTPTGPLTMLTLAERLSGGLDPKVHQGVGYQLRGEWTIDTQPFATTEVCPAGWRLVRRTPLFATLNAAYRSQDAVLGREAATPGVPVRRCAVEIAFDTLLVERTTGERLLGDCWDWSRSESTDQGLAAVGEFSARGLRVIAYSRAVKFATLGVCSQR